MAAQLSDDVLTHEADYTIVNINREDFGRRWPGDATVDSI